MIKARLTLVLAGFLSLAWSFLGFYLTDKPIAKLGILGMVSGLGMFFGPILFASAVLMLVFSFSKVREASDGRLEYDPKNLHWRMLKKLFSVEGNMGFCAAYWLTSLVILFSFICGFLVLTFSLAIYSKGLLKILQELLKAAIPLVIFFGLLFVGPIITIILPNSKNARKWTSCWLIFYLFAIFVGLPFYKLIFKDGMSVLAAIIVYVKYTLVIGLVFGVFISLFGLAMYLASKHPDNIFKKLYSAVKNKYCPILYEQSAKEIDN